MQCDSKIVSILSTVYIMKPAIISGKSHPQTTATAVENMGRPSPTMAGRYGRRQRGRTWILGQDGDDALLIHPGSC